MKALVFKTKIQNFPEFPGLHYIEISPIQIKKLGGKFLVRLICEIDGKLKYHCALQGLGNGSGWIGISKPRLKEISAIKGDTVTVKLTFDKSKYGLPMPPELKELLKQDEEGLRRFELLTRGKQRNILHYVGNAKTSDRRLDRALTVIDNLKQLKEGRETVQGIFGFKSDFNRHS